MMTETQLTLKQHYTNLIFRLKNIIIIPEKEWEAIFSEDKDINDVLSGFSLPLIGLCTFAAFLNFAFYRQAINFELALKQSVIVFTSLFAGLYLSYIVLRKILPLFNIIGGKSLAFNLPAYASGLFYVITLVTNIIPELLFLHLAIFYSYFIIWKGLINFEKPTQEQKLSLALIIVIMIHFIPFFVKYILLKLITL